MRWVMPVAVALTLVASGCELKSPAPTAPAGATQPTVPAPVPPAPLDVAAPYAAPAQPPQHPAPLTIRPSRDAHDRLSKVLSGKLVDSGDFHDISMRSDEPATPDGHAIAFTTPSGSITCVGGSDYLTCLAASGARPSPPRPVESPPGNWGPYVAFHSGTLTYGLPPGNPIIPAKAATLPYGSTIRFGEIECLSARDGITCVHFPSSTGFHLSRDDLTPLKAVEAVPADTRIEPRTPGNTFCGALIGHAAVADAIETLPDSDGRNWTEVGTGDYYTCNDLQLFQVGTNDYDFDRLQSMPTHVLVFDRGRFIGSVTDRSYPWLTGKVDDADPTLIHLDFVVPRDGKGTHAQVRARYTNGRVVLLDPMPSGAVAGP